MFLFHRLEPGASCLYFSCREGWELCENSEPGTSGRLVGQARQWQAAQGRGPASPTLSVVVAPAAVLSVGVWHTLRCEAALAGLLSFMVLEAATPVSGSENWSHLLASDFSYYLAPNDPGLP